MQKKELLAPAGDIESGYAAIYYGADAVYLGLQQFSARATATNFDEQDLNEFVAFAHSKGKKVYVTINTIIQESELHDLLKILDMCSNYRVDGVIVQDIGVAGIVKEKYPELELHASTQMAVHNKEGALALKKFGFKRVVLARELTLNEIKEIAEIPDLEIEVFIHGALCYSYSGVCLFSALEYGKSANRGKCLYPCRAEFDGEKNKAHYFSMKDMALQGEILKLPIASLKIEGRKKNALYVAAVTDYYRHILDGKGWNEKKEENIKQIFSRPWCKFHFNGKSKDVTDKNFVGHRGLLIGKILDYNQKSIKVKINHKIARHDGIQIDVKGYEKPYGFSLLKLKTKDKDVFEADKNNVVEIMLPPKHPKMELGADVYLASSSEIKGTYDYEKPKPNSFKIREKINVSVCVTPNKIVAKAKDFEFAISGLFDKANDEVKTKQAIEKSFAKTGDTDFELDKLNVLNEQNLFVPASVVNELRRNLYTSISREKKVGELPKVNQLVHYNKGYIIKIDDLRYLDVLDINRFEEIIFLLDANSKVDDFCNLPKDKIRIALPIIGRNMNLWLKKIEEFKNCGFHKWEVANYWGLTVLKDEKDISFDASLYTLNSQAVLQAKKLGANLITVPLEASEKNIKELLKNAPLPVVMVVYQDVPLFTSAVCIRDNDCASCTRAEKWLKLKKDGKSYSVLSKNCQIMLFNDEPFVLSKIDNVDYYRIDFCYKNYTNNQIIEVLSKIIG